MVCLANAFLRDYIAWKTSCKTRPLISQVEGKEQQDGERRARHWLSSCFALGPGLPWQPKGNSKVSPSREQIPTGRISHLFGRVSPTLEAVCKMINF